MGYVQASKNTVLFPSWEWKDLYFRETQYKFFFFLSVWLLSHLMWVADGGSDPWLLGLQHSSVILKTFMNPYSYTPVFKLQDIQSFPHVSHMAAQPLGNFNPFNYIYIYIAFVPISEYKVQSRFQIGLFVGLLNFLFMSQFDHVM